MSSLLALDDDISVLSSLQDIFFSSGIAVHGFLRPESASKYLVENGAVDLAVVDLFLEGEKGNHLSNEFIFQELIPRKIKYIRLTSAPRLVPMEFVGLGIFDKKKVFQEPDKFVESILKL